jgi:hypothetical protein
VGDKKMSEKSSEQKLVKGTMVIDIVKAIKGLKDIPWDKYLSKEAKELIPQRILPSVWYPYDAVMSCLSALYKMMGKSNPELARQWGRINGGRLFESVYRGIFSDQRDTESTLKRFDIIARSAFWKGISIESQEVGPRHFTVKAADNDPCTEPVYYFIQGWFDVIIERTGGKNGKVKIIEKHWEGAPATVFDVSWE